MNGFQDGKKFKLEKPVPGCLGRMVNIFDLGSVARNKLIADKPYSEGSSISRCQSDVARTSPVGDQNKTPMKTLIDQEMSKEIDYVHNSPNVVAKLMGLEPIPPQQPDIATQRSHSIAHSRSRSDSTSSYWKEDGYLRDYTDIYETTNEKKMALVRQKFMEAKCLATDERLRHSKQFQDALEVLSANKDSLLKFLQEPNSLFSKDLHNTETKRITVLKPAKMVDNCKFPVKSNEKRPKKTEYPTQPTRIVVLKPSPGRPHDVKSMSSIPSTPRISAGENSISSECPNGYIGDESSFNISETEYAGGNLSDSEVISPTSKHSWDYINRFDSPLSSSFSRASFSPESSVCREAKKRLSERWATMSSNGGYQEPKHVRRNSSTLGEMLALSDIKKTGGSKEISTNVEEPNLLRSKSVPLSSTQSGLRLNVDIPDPEQPRSVIPRNAGNGKSSKSLFMGKVSSLFFSRNRRTGREKECSSGACEDNMESKNASASLPVSSNQSSSLTCSAKEISPESKASASGATCENQEQPSPISILEPPFEEHEHTTPESPYKADQHGKPCKEVSAYSLKSNLIDKSPPIGSIARTLSWDDSCIDTASSCPLKTSLSIRGIEEEEGEWLFFLRSLLSDVGLDDDVMARWYSSESPLDPSFRDKYVDINGKEIMQEATRRQRRSMQKLVFDFVNATLLDMSRYESETGQRAKIEDEVWGRMKDWVSGESRCVDGDDSMDIESLFIERVIRKELAGKGWAEYYKQEMDSLGTDLEKRLLDDLVQEAVVELVG